MNLEGWRELVARAREEGSDETFDYIARALHELDEAKNLLRQKGYGCTGMGILETAKEVPINVNPT